MEDSPQDLKSIIELTRIYLDRGEMKKIEQLFRNLEQRREKLERSLKKQETGTDLIGIC